jgi:hypothetical protein
MTTTSRWATSGITRPPKLLIYGTHGVGKTTTAAQFPGAMVLRAEDGVAGLNVPVSPVVSTYTEAVGCLSDLFSMPPGTLVVDSIDALESMVWAETCNRLGVASIEAPGYGKGYTEADLVWLELRRGLTLLNEAGWLIILIAHAQIVQFDDPATESYSRHVIKLHKRARALWSEWVDVIGFAHWENTVQSRKGDDKKVRATGTGRRAIALQESPAYDAKNRYGMPPILPLDATHLLNALHAGGCPLPAPTAFTSEV